MSFAEFSMVDDGLRHPSSNMNYKRKHRRGAQPPQEDDTGSLTYSATSSVNSGGSAAGESTDSSFAHIMRVLALQDGPELEEVMKREGYDAKAIAWAKAKNADGISVASSLNYSVDGESALNGEAVLQSITGQPSNSYGPDGGGDGLVQEVQQTGPMTEDIVFAPANPVDRHRKGTRKSRKSKANVSPKEDRPKPMGTPPPAPRRVMEVKDHRPEEDSLWYAKWWMCGFTDALRDLVPRP